MNNVKLHLGCGNVHIDGFINIDANYLPAVDIVDNARHLRKFEENSVDLIYASNVLEHLGRWEFMPALERWYAILKKGGILRVSVPDFEALCEYYLETKDLRTMYCALYGGQDNPGNCHYLCWDFETLKNDLRTAGFVNVRRYDRNKTEHAHVRDWSLNYMPYRNKKNKILPDKEWFKGKFVALNVEAVK
jgi:predicted SAM-dependent methyltransferase